MKDRLRSFLLAGALLGAAPGLARAQSPTPLSCAGKARARYMHCVDQCRDDLVAERLACRNVRPACGEACLAGREGCLDQVQAILTSGTLPDGGTLAGCAGGTDACKAAFQGARQACVDAGCPAGQTCKICEPSDQTCADCVDQAQIADFTCRDGCRDSWETNPVVMSMRASCRSGFESCIGACPPLE